MEQKFVAPAPPPQAAPQAPAQPQVSSATYTVQKGDTLWKIAKKAEHFGQGHRWYDIWKANEAIVDDFDRIEVGQTLVVPISVADGHAWPSTPQEKRDRLMRVGADGVAEEAPEEELTN
jgi:LysM repeat protein